MCLAVVGGMKRLERHYREEGLGAGIDLRVFNTLESNIRSKLKNVDAMVIFTNKVSHAVRNEAVREAKARGIPVLMQHSCGLCTLRQCIGCLVAGEGAASSGQS